MAAIGKVGPPHQDWCSGWNHQRNGSTLSVEVLRTFLSFSGTLEVASCTILDTAHSYGNGNVLHDAYGNDACAVLGPISQ